MKRKEVLINSNAWEMNGKNRCNFHEESWPQPSVYATVYAVTVTAPTVAETVSFGHFQSVVVLLAHVETDLVISRHEADTKF